MPGLPDSRRQIARAKDLRDELAAKFRGWWSTHKHTQFLEPDPDRPEHEILKVRIIDPIPLDSLAGPLHDAVNNLRSALDSAVHAIAVGKHGAGEYTAAFPFANGSTNLERQIKGRARDVPVEIHAIFRSCGPYKGGNDTLWALNNACNSHKHQGIVKLAPAATLGNATGTGGLIRLLCEPAWDSLKNEIEIGTFVAGSGFNFHIQIGMHVAFGDIKGVAGEPVWPVLDYWIGLVEEIVSTLESEGTRLGFLK